MTPCGRSCHSIVNHVEGSWEDISKVKDYFKKYVDEHYPADKWGRLDSMDQKVPSSINQMGDIDRTKKPSELSWSHLSANMGNQTRQTHLTQPSNETSGRNSSN
ncbi:hypothetical protein TNCV_638881 [Trichonephila clavipes]|nr:hypothetical protein TNCV_638881 [Trichonephila clavipes]